VGKFGRWLVTEPLIHFLIAGLAIYLAFAHFRPATDANTLRTEIQVDRTVLLQFMQYRAKAFEPAAFAAQFDALGKDERQRLIDDYVREEVLYRESKALGLEHGDYVIRQRLVQKMGFLLEAPVTTEPTEPELKAYYNVHQDLYTSAPSWTFTHVFVNPAIRGPQRSERMAARMLVILNRAGAKFNDAPRYSDRFTYLQNYVERTADYITSQFGPDFMSALQTLPSSDQWQGPLRSSQGLHLVLVTARAAGRVPPLAELRNQVREDFKRDRDEQSQAQATRALIATYNVNAMNLDKVEQ
jgi:peptidyl-prolyl cis-trans isomerase C